MNLRFIPRDGRLILQVHEERRTPSGYHNDWYDVKGQERDDVLVKANDIIKANLTKTVKFSGPSPSDPIEFQTQVEPPENPKDWTDGGKWASPKPKEFWLIAGRYFESEHDAAMWYATSLDKAIIGNDKIIHVREVDANQNL